MLSDELRRQLEAIEDLPTLPSIALQLIDLARNPNTDVQSVESALMNDPALVARVLQVANSPLYGARQCDNLREAILLQGIDATLSLSLVMVIVQLQHGLTKVIAPESLDLNYYWRRSVLGALAARVLAQVLRRRDGDQLFLAALVQDIGVLMLARIQPELYQISARRPSHTLWAAREQQALTVSHAEISAWLLNKWDMPEYISGAVAHSHDLGQVLADRSMFERCVVFSGMLADLYLDEWISPELKSLPLLLDQFLSIDEQLLEDVLIQMSAQMRGLETVFRIPMLSESECDAKIKQAKVAMTFRML